MGAVIDDPYDELGRGYGRKRRPDPRIHALITRALGDAATVVNVIDPAVQRLAHDLAGRHWERRHLDLLDRDALDVGYRLVVAGPTRRMAS